jgi:hypothetical protein
LERERDPNLAFYFLFLVFSHKSLSSVADGDAEATNRYASTEAMTNATTIGTKRMNGVLITPFNTSDKNVVGLSVAVDDDASSSGCCVVDIDDDGNDSSILLNVECDVVSDSTSVSVIELNEL